MSGISSLLIDYSIGGTRLSVSRYWRRGPRLIARHLAKCLVRLAKSNRAMILIFSSGWSPRFRRTLGGRVKDFSGGEVILYDWLSSPKPYEIASALMNIDGFVGVETAVLLRGRNLRYAELLMKRHFDWHSLTGYIVSDDARVELPGLLDWFDARQRMDRRLRVMRGNGIYFEDWADGCALKLWFQSGQAPAVRRAVRVKQGGIVRPTR